MPFQPVPILDPGLSLALWHITEPESFFLDRLNIYENEEQILAGIRHPHKRLEWLASRLCLKELLHITHKVESLYEFTGKPILSDHSHEISYSHSGAWAAAIASSQNRVSIDIEDLNRDRNPEVSRMFMHPDEQVRFHRNPDMRYYLLLWSGKEALYKWYSFKGLTFREHLFIDTEPEAIRTSGMVRAAIRTPAFEREVTLHYRFLNQVLITWIVA